MELEKLFEVLKLHRPVFALLKRGRKGGRRRKKEES